VCTEHELGSITVRGTGLNIVAKLQHYGAMTGELCTELVIAVENVEVLGSVWMMSGTLGQVKFSTGRVGGSWNLNVWLDLSDMTELTFPNLSEPRECGNLSEWYEAFRLVRRLQDGVDDLFSKKQGFSL
jgi:hypothetical protein